MALYRDKGNQKITITPLEIVDWIIKYNSIHYLYIEVIFNMDIKQLLNYNDIKYVLTNTTTNAIIGEFIHTIDNSDEENYSIQNYTIPTNGTKTSYMRSINVPYITDGNFIANGLRINNIDSDTIISLSVYVRKFSENGYKNEPTYKSNSTRKIAQHNINSKPSYKYGNGNTYNILHAEPTTYKDLVYHIKGLLIEPTDTIYFKMITRDTNISISDINTITLNSNNIINDFFINSHTLEYCEIKLNLVYKKLDGNANYIKFGLIHDKYWQDVYSNINETGNIKIEYTNDYDKLNASIEKKFKEYGLCGDSGVYTYSAINMPNGPYGIISITLRAKTKGIQYIKITEYLAQTHQDLSNQTKMTFLGNVDVDGLMRDDITPSEIIDDTYNSIEISYTNPFTEPLRLVDYDFINTQKIQISIPSITAQGTEIVELMTIYNSYSFEIETILHKNIQGVNNDIVISKGLNKIESRISNDFDAILSKSAPTIVEATIEIPFLKTFTNISISGFFPISLVGGGYPHELVRFNITHTKPTFVNGIADITITFTPNISIGTPPPQTSAPFNTLASIVLSNDMNLIFGENRTNKIVYSIV